MIGAGEVAQCQGTVSLPGGTFMMGCDDRERCDPDEKPVHEVTVSPFEMDRCEFTERKMEELKKLRLEQFDDIETNCNIDEPRESWDWLDPDSWKERFGIKEERKTETCDMPLVNVTWNDADAICRARGMRLPTEAEWEYAARGVSGKDIYPVAGGMSLYDQDGNKLAQFGADGRAQVGSSAPNSFGLYDLAGNVWEWVADWYGPYSGGTAKDPIGPAKGNYRVVRGGSWSFHDHDASHYLRAEVRYGYHLDYYRNNLGFRCAYSPMTPEAK